MDNPIASARVATTWCTLCGARFTDDELKGAVCCPKCGDKGVPCDTALDLFVRVNWHELRVLGIWAENYAHSCDSKDETSHLTKTVHAITGRLQRQFPGKTPLTLSGEISQLKEHYDVQTQGIAKTSPIPINGPGAVTS